MPYDVRRLHAIENGKADVPDVDAAVEIVAGLVETMVAGHPTPSPKSEERYRTQARALRAVLRRLRVEEELPSSLRVWLESQPARASPLLIRVAAEKMFEPILVAVDATAAAHARSEQIQKPQPAQFVEETNAPSASRSVATSPISGESPFAPQLNDDDERGDEARRVQRTSRRLTRPAIVWILEKVVLAFVIAIVAGIIVVLATRSGPSLGTVPGSKATSDSGEQVILSQGAAVVKGYRYAITLQGFSARIGVSVSCRDSAHPGGFYTFTLRTNAKGAASTADAPCISTAGGLHWVVAGGVGSNQLRWTAASTIPGSAFAETTGGTTHTWSQYATAGGTQGPTIPANATVEVLCRVSGFRVNDGNNWWYRLASAPWSGRYYASADAFYNNGETSGSLEGTPFVDPNVPECGSLQTSGTSAAAGSTVPVMNAAGGVYWRAAPDWNTPVRRPGNGFFPGTVVAIDCFKAGLANVPGSSDYMWERARWVSGPGHGSGWINERFIDDGSPVDRPSAGVPACG